MYTGENKTALSSQAAFAETLLGLLEQMPYADISVSSLCQTSGLSRQTFYSLFQSKDNVLRYAITHLYRYPEELTDAPIPCTAAALARVFRIYIESNYDFLKLLVQQDLVFLFYECCLEWLTGHQDTVFASAQPELRQYLSGHVISTFTGVVSIYFTRSPAASEELEALLRNLLNGTYF